MKVTNTNTFERTLSHGGQDYRLMPNQSVELDLTTGEAKALGAIFSVSGKPVIDAGEKEVKK